MRRILWLASLLAVLAIPAGAAGREEQPARAPRPRIGPVRIVMLDGCAHSLIEREIGQSRTEVSIEINSSAMDLDACQIEPGKAQTAITNLAKKLEAERKAAVKKKAPLPFVLVYTGSFLEGDDVVGAWKPALLRLSRTALIIGPGGNNPELDPGAVWPARDLAVKVGNAPGGNPAGSVGEAISAYVNYGPPLDVVVDGMRFTAGGSSTAAMLFSVHLANVLATGTGQKYAYPDLLKKLKNAFQEEVLLEGDLEERFGAALR